MKSSYSCYSFICLFLLIKDSFWHNSFIFWDKKQKRHHILWYIFSLVFLRTPASPRLCIRSSRKRECESNLYKVITCRIPAKQMAGFQECEPSGSWRSISIWWSRTWFTISVKCLYNYQCRYRNIYEKRKWILFSSDWKLMYELLFD